MKRTLIIILMAAFLAAAPGAVSANPYNLFGNGNCAYFACEMMEKFWPASFAVPGSYDAKDWTRLVGQTSYRNGKYYEICQTNEPRPGDFIVWPGTQDNVRGHVAFILEVEYNSTYNVAEDSFAVYTSYRVAESVNYAGEDFPDKWQDYCRYRYYWYDHTKDMVFLACKEK